MNIEVDNGWRGPVAKYARDAAVSLRGDSTATLAIARADLIAAPQPGTKFTANDNAFAVVERMDAPRGLLMFLCRKLDA